MATQALRVQSRAKMLAFKPIVIALLVLVIYLEVFISRAANIPVRMLLDALVVVLAGGIMAQAFFRQRLRILHVLLLFNIAVFTVLSLFGALDPSFSTSLLSAIIFSKFLIVFFLVGKFDMADLKLTMHILAVLHILGGLGNVVAPELFTALLPQVSYQIDTSRLMGLSLNANRSAAISTVLFLYFLYVDRNRLLVAIFLAFIVLSGSRSLTVIAGLLAVYMFLKSRASLSMRLVTSTLAGLLALVVVATMISFDETLIVIQNTLGGDLRYIRAAMLGGGYFLANEFFPLGVGGGQFGSSLSAGSEAYRMVGISHWASVIDMWGVYDSGLGAILGEYGWLGLAIYILVVYVAMKNADQRKVPLMAALFLLVIILMMNMVRTVASDFFFSFFFLFVYTLVMHQHHKPKAG